MFWLDALWMSRTPRWKNTCHSQHFSMIHIVILTPVPLLSRRTHQFQGHREQLPSAPPSSQLWLLLDQDERWQWGDSRTGCSNARAVQSMIEAKYARMQELQSKIKAKEDAMFEKNVFFLKCHRVLEANM